MNPKLLTALWNYLDGTKVDEIYQETVNKLTQFFLLIKFMKQHRTIENDNLRIGHSFVISIFF